MARSATHVFDIEIEINLFNQSLLKTATLAENIQKALDTQPVSPGTAVPSAVAGVLDLTATTNATQPFPSASHASPGSGTRGLSGGTAGSTSFLNRLTQDQVMVGHEVLVTKITTGLQPKLSEIEKFVEKHLVEDTETGLKAIAHMIKTLLENSPNTSSYETLGAALDESKAQHLDSVKAYSALMASLASKDAQVQAAENRLALQKKAAAANLAIKEKYWADGKYEAHEALAAENKTLFAQLASTTVTLERLIKEKERICDANADLTSKNAVLVITNAELDVTNAEVVNQNLQLTALVVMLFKVSAILRMRIAQLERKNAILREQVTCRAKQMKGLKAEVQAWKKKVAGLEKLEKELRGEIKTKIKQHIEDKKEIAELSSDQTGHKKREKSLQESLDLARKQREEALVAKKGLQVEVASLKKQEKMLTDEKEARDADITRLTESNKTLTDTNARLQKEGAAKDAEIKWLRERLDKTTRLLQHAKKLYHEYHSLAINFQSGVNRFRHEHSTPDRFHVPPQPGKPGPEPAHLQPTETGDFTNEYDQWELENVAAASGTPHVTHTASGRDAAAKRRAADPTDSDSDLVSESDELPPARTTDFAQTAPAARGANQRGRNVRRAGH